MPHQQVAVLRGGPSDEYTVSLETGKAVTNALRELGRTPRDIVITRQGEWLVDGFSRPPEKALAAVDAVFIALHGHYGEDGQVQRVLERLQIPFTGTRSLSSATAFNKEFTKNLLLEHGLKMPRHRRLTRQELRFVSRDPDALFTELGPELFIKPVQSGSSIGVGHVSEPNKLLAVVEAALEAHEALLVEEYITGREATVGILERYREESLYTLPPVEIVPPPETRWFTNADKYNGKTEELVPGRFAYGEKARLAEAARLAHELIGCRHYSRSDFIIRDGEAYFLEINTLPGLTSESLFPKAAAAVGLTFPELIQHLVDQAAV